MGTIHVYDICEAYGRALPSTTIHATYVTSRQASAHW